MRLVSSVLVPRLILSAAAPPSATTPLSTVLGVAVDIDRHELTVSSAGHLPPLLVSDGTAVLGLGLELGGVRPLVRWKDYQDVPADAEQVERWAATLRPAASSTTLATASPIWVLGPPGTGGSGSLTLSGSTPRRLASRLNDQGWNDGLIYYTTDRSSAPGATLFRTKRFWVMGNVNLAAR